MKRLLPLLALFAGLSSFAEDFETPVHADRPETWIHVGGNDSAIAGPRGSVRVVGEEGGR